MIILFEKFLELEKSYPYKFLHRKGFEYIYEFTDDSGIIYKVGLTYENGILYPDWADKTQFDYTRKVKQTLYKRTRELDEVNINYLYYVLNTFFKIINDFVDSRNVKKINIGAYSKTKYKIYRKIVEDMNDRYKIVAIHNEEDKFGLHQSFDFIPIYKK